MTKVIIDTHLHIYRCFDPQQAINNLNNNISRFNDADIIAGIITEPANKRYFFSKSHEEITDCSLNDSGKYILVKGEKIKDIYLFKGIQVVTSENIEVLGLFTDIKIKSPVPAKSVVKMIIDNNGIPVVSWSPGKWLGKRGKTVRDLLAVYKSDEILLGDTSLRPMHWPLSKISTEALKDGYKLIYGSDPLPFGGEEKHIGRYATVYDFNFDINSPEESIKNAVKNEIGIPSGQRSGLPELTKRLFKHARNK